MRRLLPLLALMALSIQAFSQQECAFILEESQDMFDAGLIEDIPEKLSPCLESGFTNEEKLQAFKLIILSYLFDDNVAEADAVMEDFLSDYPAYEPVATDPREFVALMETYDTRPIFELGIMGGANFSIPYVVSRLGTHNFAENKGYYSSGTPGFHASFRFERRLSPTLDFGAEALFLNSHFSYLLDNDPSVDNFTGEVTDFATINYREVQNQIMIPVFVTYKFAKEGFIPYVSAGFEPALMLSATGSGDLNYATGIPFEDQNIPGVNLMDKRRFFNMAALLSFGFKYDVGPGFVFLDLRYHAFFSDLLRQSGDGFSLDLAGQIFYVSDDLLLHNVGISAGFMLPIYNPKKITN